MRNLNIFIIRLMHLPELEYVQGNLQETAQNRSTNVFTDLAHKASNIKHPATNTSPTYSMASVDTNSAVKSHIYPPWAFCLALKPTVLNTFQVPNVPCCHTSVPLHIMFLLPANPSLLCSVHQLPLTIKLKGSTAPSESPTPPLHNKANHHNCWLTWCVFTTCDATTHWRQKFSMNLIIYWYLMVMLKQKLPKT